MCGLSETEIKGEKASLFMGYCESALRVGDAQFCVSDLEERTSENSDDIFNKLMSYTKKELVTLMIDIVKNGEEG